MLKKIKDSKIFLFLSVVLVTLGVSLSLRQVLAYKFKTGDTGFEVGNDLPENPIVLNESHQNVFYTVIDENSSTGHFIKLQKGAGNDKFKIEYDGDTWAAGNVCSDSAGKCLSDLASFAEADGIIGNEVVDVANSTLTRSGTGTTADPYKLSLNLGNINTWTASQTFAGGLAVSGGTLSLLNNSITDSMVSDTLTASNLVAGSSVVSDAEVDDNITASNYLPLNGAVSMSGTLQMSASGENDITAADELRGYDDLFLKGNSDETAPIYYGASAHHFYTGGVEKMIILENGNVGIGTISPGAKLGVAGQIKIKDGTQGLGRILTSDADGLASWKPLTSSADNLGNHTATENIRLGAYWLSGDGGSEGVFVDGSSNVGIGDSSPDYKLDVAGSAGIDGILTMTGSSANIALGSNYLSGDGGDEGVFVDGSGKVGIGIASPGQKLTVSPNSGMTFVLGGLPNPVMSVGAYGGSPSDGIGFFSHDTTSGYIGWVGAIRTGAESGGWGSKTLRFQVPDVAGNVISALRIQGGSGKVYIGTSESESSKNMLDVDGRMAVGSGYAGVKDAPSEGMIIEGNVGIGTATPDAKLTVSGQIKITGGSPGSGKFLKSSDSSGLASWGSITVSDEYSCSYTSCSIGVHKVCFLTYIKNQEDDKNGTQATYVSGQSGGEWMIYVQNDFLTVNARCLDW